MSKAKSHTRNNEWLLFYSTLRFMLFFLAVRTALHGDNVINRVW